MQHHRKQSPQSKEHGTWGHWLEMPSLTKSVFVDGWGRDAAQKGVWFARPLIG